MKTYLKALSLWDVVENDDPPSTLPNNPTVAQTKKYEEDMAKRPRTLSCLHSALSEGIFTLIMACETPKEAWEKLEEEFEGNSQTKLMQILNLKREFEMLSMKKSEGAKEYENRMMAIVNQIKLPGGDSSSQRVVDKLLVTLPDRYETKISTLEDSKNLSTLTFGELINALHAVDQIRQMRGENDDSTKGEEAFLAKTSYSKGKGKIPQCGVCKKLGHEENQCWHKGKTQCFKCK
ncbi:uncharacterized protein LOC125496749 [Beta vulgaris subsp. vulgaris]|uniref:uncharacterized protein LOC125496749 n=1 Tax=Beta vulgaris subsp. vulgaris TaxID=3555 RepID=UPI0020371072|nr:uncharacterized protein LOC125496749 [Beta vulgaris subsp. vulgaris]